MIDDDEGFGALAIEVLAGLGLSAQFYRGPFGVLRAIRETERCTVLLDVNMPVIDTPLLLRMIRGTFAAHKVEVILCSGMEERSLRKLADGLGVRGILPKAHFEQRASDAITRTLRGA